MTYVYRIYYKCVRKYITKMSFAWYFNKQHENLNCSDVGVMIKHYQIGNHLDELLDAKTLGIIYLHDKGIEIRGDCNFKVSELNKKDKEMYIHIRQHYLINK